MKKTLMRWLLVLSFIMGNSIYSYADVVNTLEESKYTQEFWKLYTDALRGDKIAQFQVGVIYERGLGVDKNETLAAQWYEKSALQGHIDAQYNIGIMYISGRGVEQNEGSSMMWLSLAAKQGDKEARKLLLGIIDNKLDKKVEKSVENKPEPAMVTGDKEEIIPVKFSCKEENFVCTQPGGVNCTHYKAKTTFTSKSKRGDYYKISGIVMEKGWKAFEKEGWIDASMVEVR